MESRAKLFGHPIHQMLIVFPLGLLATAVIFDFIAWRTGEPHWLTAGYYMMGAGIIGGFAAAIFGVVDYLGIPDNTRAKSIGMLHGVGNVIVLRSSSPASCFAVPIRLRPASWRISAPTRARRLRLLQVGWGASL